MIHRWLHWFRHEAKAMASEAGSFAVRWFQLVGVLHCLQEYGIDFSTTVGSSMVPVFNPSGDVLLFERLTQRLHGFEKGDVVVAISPKDPEARICKRVVALPGDRVVMRERGPEPVEIIVPLGHVWLLGDNRSASLDSRHYGPVPIGLLQGKVRLKLWPPQEIGLIPKKPELCMDSYSPE
eukprot:TRINITY_DN20717_c0_g1_i2.p1 TRINITY_DN20717_c0_g1~~TRINITY_DN20717_c0_g1_i2.p1  ORF type:complete len:180 (+),score=15.52 TRINITY_DN20717_c0_g1_i2:113-652(+)